jgi:hypothetical protein
MGLRQCPSCRTISSFSAPTCEQCGLRFVKGSRLSNMTAMCLRIGGAAIILAAAVIVLRLT